MFAFWLATVAIGLIIARIIEKLIIFSDKKQNTLNGSSETSKNLLVIAHPDDEVMFFTPLLSSLKAEKLYILCFSNGKKSFYFKYIFV